MYYVLYQTMYEINILERYFLYIGGKIINIKKGQFLAPWDMVNVIDKARTAAP